MDASAEMSESESLSEGSVPLMDVTFYVADLSGLLMLCKEDENMEYRNNIQLLKGDRESVEEAIKKLKSMEQTVAVKNAIGVGYIRLVRCEEAREILEQALSISGKDSEQACILSNLANLCLIGREDFTQKRMSLRYEQAIEKEQDPQNRLIIRLNRICCGPAAFLNKKDPTGAAVNEFKQLLEEEKRFWVQIK